MSVAPMDQLLPPPPPVMVTQPAYMAHSGDGSVGPVIGVLAVITVLGVIAVMIGRICSGRRIMGHGLHYDFEAWFEQKCSSCIDGRIGPPPPSHLPTTTDVEKVLAAVPEVDTPQEMKVPVAELPAVLQQEEQAHAQQQPQREEQAHPHQQPQKQQLHLQQQQQQLEQQQQQQLQLRQQQQLQQQQLLQQRQEQQQRQLLQQRAQRQQHSQKPQEQQQQQEQVDNVHN